jgi:hypothetical protein
VDAPKKRIVPPIAHDLCADNFAPPLVRRRREQLTTAELVNRFVALGERQAQRKAERWTTCGGLDCDAPVLLPQRICDVCHSWICIDLELRRMAASIGSST